MKRFLFAEQPLLSLRDQQRRIAELQVMQNQHELNRAESNLLQAEQALDLANQWLREPHRDGVVHLHQTMQTMVDWLAQCKAHRSQAQTQLELARQQLQAINRTVEALQMLKNMRQVDYRRKTLREEQVELDADTSRRWTRIRQSELHVEDETTRS